MTLLDRPKEDMRPMTCMAKIKFGFAFGFSVGMVTGALFGINSVLQNRMYRRRFGKIVGNAMLEGGGAFGTIMAINTGMRC